ncbi:gem-associated protein 5 isoform X1 [Vespula squamosa]|uniref:Gem-associated protein 5 isoform X1 n=1 Tax=Vespula squamosa TaxID=30214 RepID=A0ABD2B9G8_VESSQ
MTVAHNATKANVLTGLNDKVNDTEEISSRTVNKVFATLNGLAWNPHLNGYFLISNNNTTTNDINVENKYTVEIIIEVINKISEFATIQTDIE